MSFWSGLLPGTVFALCWLVAPAAYSADVAAVIADPGQARDFSPGILAKVIPGHSTKTEVQALLGQPWRTTFSDDSDEPGPVVWEYRGRNANGTYRVHIEFNAQDTTTLIAEIPDSKGEAPARVAKPR